MINCTIKIQNLTSKPELNSQIGIVQSYNPQNNRYVIQITSKSPPPVTPGSANNNGNNNSNSNAASNNNNNNNTPILVSLKIDNIKEANTVDKIRGQYYIFLNVLSYMNRNKAVLWNDAKTKWNNTVQQLVQSGVMPASFANLNSGGSGSGIKLEYLLGGILVALLAIIWKVGLTKFIFFISVFGILLTVALPDLMTAARNFTASSGGSSSTNMTDQLKIVASNFPRRWREMIYSHSGYNVSPKVANGLLVALLLLSGKILLFTPLQSSATSSSGKGGTKGGLTQTELNMMKQQQQRQQNNYIELEQLYTIDEIYKLGYEDGSSSKEYGFSLPDNHDELIVTSKVANSQNAKYSGTYNDIDADADMNFNYDDYQPTTPPLPPSPPKSRGSGVGFGTLMSMFALFRSVKEMGFVNGRFELQYFKSNLQSMPPLKMAFMGFMLYRVVSAFM